MFRRHVVRQAAIVAMVVLAVTAVLSAPLFTSSPPDRSGKVSPAQQQAALNLLVMSGGGEAHTRIEKQTWWLDGITPDPSHTVVNPGGVGTWDINDNNDWVAGGSLPAGAITIGSWQHVWDWNPIYRCFGGVCADRSGPSNEYGATVTAPSDGLSVTVCYQPQARCFPLVAVYDAGARLYRWHICTEAIYQPDDAAIVDIAGSNGGRGVPTTMTLTVTNPTSRVVKDIIANFGISSDVTFRAGCTVEPPAHFDYPYGWTP